MPTIIDYHWIGGLTDRSVMIKVVVSKLMLMVNRCFLNMLRTKCPCLLISIKVMQSKLSSLKPTKSQKIATLL